MISVDSLKRRLVFIDALRGVAALSVVLFHAIEGKHIPALQAAMPAWLLWIIEHGHLGVAIFFVISGFVIALSLNDRPVGLATTGRFMLRRSIRIDPPYWVAIVMAIAYSVLASMLVKSRAPESFSATQILAHIFYVQDLLGYKNINTVFWTLCLEIQFYLVYALLLATGRGSIALLLGGAVSLLWPLGIGPSLHPGLFLPYWHGFLLGVAVYWALRGKLPWLVFAAYALVILLGAIAHENNFSIACAMTASLIFIVGTMDRLHSLLNWRWLQGLGAISYSLYLIHNPATGATFRVGKLIGGNSAASNALWWALSIAACIATAWLMLVLIERPSTKLSRKVALSVK